MNDAADRLKQAGPQIAALAAHIRALAGDDDEAWVDTLDGETDAVSAARAVVRELAETEAFMAALAALKTQYDNRLTRIRDRRARLRGALSTFMVDVGAKGMPLPEATLTMSHGQPQLVGDALPINPELVRVKEEPDRVKIKAHLEAGGHVDGYSLSNAGPVLTVRWK